MSQSPKYESFEKALSAYYNNEISVDELMKYANSEAEAAVSAYDDMVQETRERKERGKNVFQNLLAPAMNSFT